MADPQEVAGLVAEFGKAYTRWVQGVMRKQAGTSPARARLLAALHCTSPQRMSDLSDRLGVTPRNVTKLVDALEAERLLIRTPHPQDRRATLVHLTDRGLAAAKETILASHGTVARLYERLAPADREDFARVLRLLIDGLGELQKADDEQRGAVVS